MERPTSMIRELLILGFILALLKVNPNPRLEELLVREMTKGKQRLKETGVDVMERRVQGKDIWIKYRYKYRLYESTYMRPMLEAEARAILKRLIKGRDLREMDLWAL